MAIINDLMDAIIEIFENYAKHTSFKNTRMMDLE